MTGIRKWAWVLWLLAATAGAPAAEEDATAVKPPDSNAPSTVAASDPASESADPNLPQLQLLTQAGEAFRAGHRQEAIRIADEVIAHYRATTADERRAIYAAKDAAEALLYLAKATNEKRDAIVLSYAWGDAYMLKGYALVELGQVKEAREAIEAAVALSPLNPQYLAEMGYLTQIDRKWTESLEFYKRAEDGARIVPPEDKRNAYLALALRGQGYALIELGRLDEAEALYRKCLELDGGDEKARNELKYIEAERRKLQAHEAR